MFRDEFKSRYTTIPFAVYHGNYKNEKIESISHQHKEIELLTILDGSATFYIDSVAYDVEKGDILIISPYSLHNATIYPDKSFSHFCLCFDLNIIYDKSLNSELEDGSLIIYPLIKHTEKSAYKLSEYIVAAFHACDEMKNGWEFNAIGNMSLLFSVLKEGNYIFKSSANKKNKNFCKNTMDFIDKNYNKNITSSDAAEALFINNSYFCRTFKKNFGNCFQKYLCAYRIEKSTILLKTTDMSISEISEKVGFNSFCYFSKLFKEIYNCSPSEYRKKV